MVGAANDLNIGESGFQSFDNTNGIFKGRTLTAGTGIAITNGDGVSGSPVISLTGGGVATEHLTGNTGGQLNPDGSNNFNTIGTGSITIDGSSSTLTTQLTGLTNHTVLVGAGTATITKVGPGSSGQVLQSGGASADPVYSTATYPATAGTSGNILTSNGTNFNSVSSATLFIPNSVFNIYEDFVASFPSTSGLVGTSAWSFNTVSAWLLSLANATSDHPGVIGNSSMTSTARSISMTLPSQGSGTIVLGGGIITLDWVFNIAIASSGNRYNLALGIGDTNTSAAWTNGIWFGYSDNVNSGNWTLNTNNNTSPTTTNTSTPASVGWHHAKIVINAAGSSAEFFMDGVSLGVIATTLPTTTIFPNFVLAFSAGTIASSTILIDLFYFQQILTNPR